LGSEAADSVPDDVLIDITRLASRLHHKLRPTGVDRVSLAYIDRYREHALALMRFGGRWMVFSRSDSEAAFSALINSDDNGRWRLRLAIANAYATAWRGKEGAILFNTGHSGLDLPDYEERIRQQRWRPVFFLHDLIPLSHPEYCRAGEADKHHRRLRLMLTVGRGIVVNSRSTLVELQDYAREWHLPTPPCLVAPLAPQRFAEPTKRMLERSYFVILGTIEARKNHLLLLNLWRQFARDLGKAAPALVIIGRRGWECEQVIDMLERCPELRLTVREFDDCPDDELANWLGHARALLFPSFVEGFGIPLAEALAAGVPVIASDLPVFREIAGDIPEYLSPLDGSGWQRLILDYASPHSLRRKAQMERLQHFRASDWSDHFTAVDEWLREL